MNPHGQTSSVRHVWTGRERLLFAAADLRSALRSRRLAAWQRADLQTAIVLVERVAQR